MNVLNLSKISKSFGERTLFDNVSFMVGEKDKIGFIGANGAGKTTLFKIITGEVSPDNGIVTFSSDVKIGYMRQNPEFKSELSLYDEVLTAFSDIIRLEEELLEIESQMSAGNFCEDNVLKQQSLLKKYEDMGGLTYKSRAKSVLTGLGFSAEDLTKKCTLLSGGEQTRASLAKLLLSGAEVLLLDEPTNHLDMDALTFLEGYLRDYNGAVIAISHDRYFLDRVTDKTMQLLNRRIEIVPLPYTRFIEFTSKRREDEEKQYQNDLKEIKRIEGIIETQRRFNREKNIRMAESRQKVLDKKIAQLSVPERAESKADFAFTSASHTGKDVLHIENLSKSFDGVTLFDNFNIDIKRGEKVFLLGANGTGKTTLLNIIYDAVKADKGEIIYGSGVEIGYYRQHSVLDGDKTIIEEIMDNFPKLTVTQTRNSLAAFSFFGDDVFKTIRNLSGGEKARVSLLKLILQNPNFIIMDEPTNHLDLPSREALENALSLYNGTCLIISHDRYFINKLAEKIVTFDTNSSMTYAGNYDYYLEHKPEENKKNEKKSKETNYFKEKEHKASIRKLQNALARIEEKISAAENELDKLNNALLQTGADYEKAASLSSEIETFKQSLDEMYLEWDDTNTELEKTTRQ